MRKLFGKKRKEIKVWYQGLLLNLYERFSIQLSIYLSSYLGTKGLYLIKVPIFDLIGRCTQ